MHIILPSIAEISYSWCVCSSTEHQILEISSEASSDTSSGHWVEHLRPSWGLRFSSCVVGWVDGGCSVWLTSIRFFYGSSSWKIQHTHESITSVTRSLPIIIIIWSHPEVQVLWHNPYQNVEDEKGYLVRCVRIYNSMKSSVLNYWNNIVNIALYFNINIMYEGSKSLVWVGVN